MSGMVRYGEVGCGFYGAVWSCWVGCGVVWYGSVWFGLVFMESKHNLYQLIHPSNIMVSQTISFQINLERLEQLSKLQKVRKRTTISPDLFAKELVFEKLDECGVKSL